MDVYQGPHRGPVEKGSMRLTVSFDIARSVLEDAQGPDLVATAAGSEARRLLAYLTAHPDIGI